MSNNFKITIVNKTKILEDYDGIKIFIDGFEIKPGKKSYNYTTYEGKHTIRIEQKKFYKNRYFYLIAPLLIFDISALEKTPLYAAYEAEFFLDKDINIDVILKKGFIKPRKFIKTINYYFNVTFDKDVKVNLVNNDFIATDKERKRWLWVSVTAITFPTTLLMLLFGILAIKLFEQKASTSMQIFFTSLSVIFGITYIFLLSNCYANYKNKGYKRMK